MRSSLAALFVFLASPTAVHATEWMNCSAGADGASISMLMGQVPVAAVTTVNIEAGGKNWSTVPADGAKTIVVGQAFENHDMLSVDLTDDNISEIIARLRIVKASEGDTYAAGGYLHISGVGAWAVSCEGP